MTGLTYQVAKIQFFKKISDYQQSVVSAPSRGLPHTSPALLVVADFKKRI
jgi:hypothetical protein